MTPPKLNADPTKNISADPALGHVGQVERGAPATGVEPSPAAPAAAPVRDGATDAAALRGMGGFGQGRVNPLLAGSSGRAHLAETRLPGGSVPAAWERADEFGPIADRAAHLVASRHPELFPELA